MIKKESSLSELYIFLAAANLIALAWFYITKKNADDLIESNKTNSKYCKFLNDAIDTHIISAVILVFILTVSLIIIFLNHA